MHSSSAPILHPKEVGDLLDFTLVAIRAIAQQAMAVAAAEPIPRPEPPPAPSLGEIEGDLSRQCAMVVELAEQKAAAFEERYQIPVFRIDLQGWVSASLLCEALKRDWGIKPPVTRLVKGLKDAGWPVKEIAFRKYVVPIAGVSAWLSSSDSTPPQ